MGFLTKPKLGLAMLERAHAAGLPFAWVTADSVYGADHSLRRWLQEKELGYVLAVTRAQRLGFDRVEEHASEVPPGSWHRLSAGDGAKGPRLYDWAYAPYGSDAAPGWEKGLLIRRRLADPGDLAFYLTHARHGTALARFGAGGRHALDDRGLLRGGQRRGRPRPVRGPVLDRLAPPRNARHRWPTPISPSSARPSSGDEPTLDLAAELLPLTLPELRRLLWHLVFPPRPTIEAVLAWSRWRRRHQQCARRSHWRRRTSNETRL